MRNRDCYPRGKAAGPEANQSPPSSAKVEKAWNYTSTPPIRLHGVVVRLITGITLPLHLPFQALNTRLCESH